MKIDFDTLIYIIVMIVFILLGALGRKRKPVQQAPLPGGGDESYVTPEDVIAEKLKAFLGNYDQDLNVGVISPEQAFSAMYAMKMHGYSEYLGIDINPERMPVDRALMNNMDRLKAIIQATDEVDHELVIACIENQDLNRGVLEAYLTRVAHPNAKGLSPMPGYKKR